MPGNRVSNEQVKHQAMRCDRANQLVLGDLGSAAIIRSEETSLSVSCGVWTLTGQRAERVDVGECLLRAAR
jgi:hypothetical protein